MRYEIELAVSMDKAFEYAKAIALLFGGEVESVFIGPNGNPSIIWKETQGSLPMSLALWRLETEPFTPQTFNEVREIVRREASHLLA